MPKGVALDLVEARSAPGWIRYFVDWNLRLRKRVATGIARAGQR
jgi:hypothetical protein